MANKTKQKIKPKILITGGLGFIGGHVAEEAYKQGFEVYVLARHNSFNSKYNQHLVDIGAELYIGDLRDKTFVARAISLVDGVINVAGLDTEDPYSSLEVNTQGAINVFEGCRQFNKPCIHVSTEDYFSNSANAITKFASERFAQLYSFMYKTKVNIVRLPLVFGERQLPMNNNHIAKMITSAVRGKPIKMAEEYEDVYDVVYVKDVSAILVKLLGDVSKPEAKTGLVYSIGTGEQRQLSEIGDQVLTKCENEKYNIVNTSATLDKKVVLSQNPYAYEYSSFEESLDKTIEWYKLMMKDD